MPLIRAAYDWPQILEEAQLGIDAQNATEDIDSLKIAHCDGLFTLRECHRVLWLCATMMNLLPTLAEPRHFALWERGLFVALAAASIYGFWRRFGPILGRILQSKKDPDFHLFPIGKRAWDFVWEVLLQ